MDRGWTRSWRREMDSAVWRQPPMYYRFWKWLHANAAHAGSAKAMGVKPGTVLTSYRAISEGLEYGDPTDPIRPSGSTIRAMLVWMEHEEMIRCKAGSREFGTTIIIRNWEKYQSADPEGSPVTKAPPKPKRKPKAPYEPSPEAVRTLQAWVKHRELPVDGAGKRKKPDDYYHKFFDLMHTQDKVPWEDKDGVPGIYSRCRWAVTEWIAGMIQSPAKMRGNSKKYPDMKEHEVMAGQISDQGSQPGNGNGAGHYERPGRQDWEDD